MREIANIWIARVFAAIDPHLDATIDTRTDAKETTLEKTIRLSSRPANDATGTTGARARVREALIRVKREARDSGKKQGRLVDTIAEKGSKANAVEFQRVIGVDPKTLGAPVADAIEQFRKENTELITSIPEKLIEQVSEVVDDAWTRGARVETLRAEIQKRFDVTKNRADLIARDQTLKLNSQLSKTRAQAAGITRYVWVTSHDERVRGNPSGLYPNPSKTGRQRPDHYVLDGKEFSYDDPPVVDERTGRRANPGEDYQCRCTAMPVLDFLDEDNTQDTPDERTQPEPEAPVAIAPAAPALPPEPVRTPIVARAKHLELAIKQRNGVIARDVLREHIAQLLPGATTKDDRNGRSTDVLYATAPTDPRYQWGNAFHDWNGDLAVREDVLARVEGFAENIANGKYGENLDKQLVPIRVQSVDGWLRATDKNELSPEMKAQLNAANTLVHEELHGHSRMSRASYRGTGALLEEVGTELNARHLTSTMTPELAASAEVAAHFDHKALGAYSLDIQQVVATVAKEAGVDEQTAVRHIREAHAKGVLAEGAPFASPDEHVAAFISALPYDKWVKSALASRLNVLGLQP